MSRQETNGGHAKTGGRAGIDPPHSLPFEGVPLVRCAAHFLFLLLAGFGWAGGAWAEGGDPTRAPAVWLAANPVAPGVTPVEAPLRMQMTLTSKTRKLAVIDGEVVKVGDQYNGSKVLAVKADKVVMEDPAKSLSVTPGVTKTAPASAKDRKKSVVLPAGSVSSKAIRE